MTLQFLSVTFSLPLQHEEIYRWRGAWAEMAGLEQDVFHNHRPGDNNYFYRYPLVQYRTRRRKAALVAINEAVGQVQQALSENKWMIRWDNEPTQLGLERLQLETFELHMPRKAIDYSVKSYLPFNDDNYREYVHAPNLMARVDLLQRVLTGHLLGCCSGIGYLLPEHLEVTLTHLDRSRMNALHGITRPVFDLRFRTNLYLPTGLAIGKGVSHGFGVVFNGN